MESEARSVTFTSRTEYLAWLFEHGEVIRVLGVERGPDPDAYRLTVTFSETAPRRADRDLTLRPASG